MQQQPALRLWLSAAAVLTLPWPGAGVGWRWLHAVTVGFLAGFEALLATTAVGAASGLGVVLFRWQLCG
jgi:hypothetical protein